MTETKTLKDLMILTKSRHRKQKRNWTRNSVTPTFNTKGYSDDLKTTKMDIIIIGLHPMPMEDVIEIQSGIFSD